MKSIKSCLFLMYMSSFAPSSTIESSLVAQSSSTVDKKEKTVQEFAYAADGSKISDNDLLNKNNLRGLLGFLRSFFTFSGSQNELLEKIHNMNTAVDFVKILHLFTEDNFELAVFQSEDILRKILCIRDNLNRQIKSSFESLLFALIPVLYGSSDSNLTTIEFKKIMNKNFQQLTIKTEEK